MRRLLKALLRLLIPEGLRRRLRNALDGTLQTAGPRLPPDFHRTACWRQGYGVAYEEFKLRFCTSAVGDATLLGALRTADQLPSRYGIGMDERCVEFPWLVSQLPDIPCRVLDAGSAMNHAFILDTPAARNKSLSIMTLAPENACYWSRGISYLYGDLRRIDFRDAWFDVVASVSTLEHVGLDNTEYTRSAAHREASPGDFTRAMQEMWRVLRPGGLLLLTVPYGTHRVFRTHQMFDSRLLAQAIDAVRPRGRSEAYFRYDALGWRRASKEECAPMEYVEWTTWPAEKWPVPTPIEPDFAIAARAVACLRLEK